MSQDSSPERPRKRPRDCSTAGLQEPRESQNVSSAGSLLAPSSQVIEQRTSPPARSRCEGLSSKQSIPTMMARTVLDKASVIPPSESSGTSASGSLGDGYCYSPLLNPGNIRLLRLFPHKNPKAPIQCQLFEYPLQELGQGVHLYEALSYVWGSEEGKQPIYIQSDDKHDDLRRLLVTQNLYTVLLQVRNRFFGRVMWIDAVCINQENNDEKGQQVQSMARIYAYADRVIVWLGEAAGNSGEAFKAIRKAAREGPVDEDESTDVPSQQAIFAVLERPWFQRIWVVQEIAAARYAVIKCGPFELDGFTFCSGIDALNLFNTRPDLRGLIAPITYLIRDTVFRPRYETVQSETSQPSTFSLSIHPLSELVDMYHIRKATNRLDKVYALLGMSSDDPGMVGLLADYEKPWGTVFRRLVQFSLSDQVFVDTWDDCGVAVIQGKGHILGKIHSVDGDSTRADMQSITIAWTRPFGDTNWMPDRFNLRASARSLHKGDAVCLLEGASRPTIVRACKGYSAIIMIAVPLAVSKRKWQEQLRSITTSPMDFVLIWDWDVSRHKPQDSDQDYASFISLQPGPQQPWSELQYHLAKVIRLWNFGISLNVMGRYKDAWMYVRQAVEAYGTALRSRDADLGHSAWIDVDKEVLVAMDDLVVGGKGTPIEPKNNNGQTLLHWAAMKGHQGIVKLVLNKDAAIDVYDDDYLTPLWFAAARGHEGVVKLLLDKGAYMDTYQKSYGTPLYVASHDGHDRIVQMLLGKGAGVNIWGGFYVSPVRAASIRRHSKIVQMLLDKGADINEDHGYTSSNSEA